MDSKWKRAALGLPILAFSGVMIHAAILNQSVQSYATPLAEGSVFRANGRSVPLLKQLYHLPIVDEVLARITPSFLYLQSFVDPIAYWQSLIFLVDYSALHAILLTESSKPASPAIIRYPSIATMLAQFIPAGIVIPVVLYAHFVYSKSSNTIATASQERVSLNQLCILPSLLLCYFGSLLPSYFHPTLEGRHWWNWIWQLYPIWTSLSLFVMTSFAGILGLGAFAKDNSRGVRMVTVMTLFMASIAVNAAAFLWSDMSQLELFYPSYIFEGPTNGAVALRTILQYDQLCCQGAAILWVSYQLWQLQSVPQLFILPSLCIATAVLTYGWCTGAILLVGWTIKELISDVDSKKAKVA